MSRIQRDNLPNERIIAIDGTSGSGKSTVARGLAAELGLDVLETGSLYRAVTLIAIENNIDVHDEKKVFEIAQNLDFHFEIDPFIGSRKITREIRTHKVVANVSLVAKHPKVREVVTQIIRHWIIQHGGGVIEGRDITSVVAPNAKVKVFLDAPEEIRAKRRYQDTSDNRENRTKEEIQSDLAFRDKIDASRQDSPLTRIKGVYEIDTSLYSPQEIINLISRQFLLGD